MFSELFTDVSFTKFVDCDDIESRFVCGSSSSNLGLDTDFPDGGIFSLQVNDFLFYFCGLG